MRLSFWLAAANALWPVELPGSKACSFCGRKASVLVNQRAHFRNGGQVVPLVRIVLVVVKLLGNRLDIE